MLDIATTEWFAQLIWERLTFSQRESAQEIAAWFLYLAGEDPHTYMDALHEFVGAGGDQYYQLAPMVWVLPSPAWGVRLVVNYSTGEQLVAHGEKNHPQVLDYAAGFGLWSTDSWAHYLKLASRETLTAIAATGAPPLPAGSRDEILARAFSYSVRSMMEFAMFRPGVAGGSLLRVVNPSSLRHHLFIRPFGANGGWIASIWAFTSRLGGHNVDLTATWNSDEESQREFVYRVLPQLVAHEWPEYEDRLLTQSLYFVNALSRLRTEGLG